MSAAMTSPPLTLRALEPADCESIAGWIQSEDMLWQWSGPWDLTWPLDAAQLVADLRRHGDPRFLLAAVAPADGALLGMARLTVQRHHGLGQLGRILVAPEARGRGYGVALMQALISRAFDELGLHRLTLSAYTFNHGAIATYRRVGFTVEGRARDSTRFSDGYRSGVTMALLAGDRDAAVTAGTPAVRPVRLSDAPRVAALLTELGYPHDATAARARISAWQAESDGTVLVAEDGGVAAGLIAVHRIPYFERGGAFARIVALSVDPGSRRAHIGRRLVDAAEAWAAARGCHTLEVTSRRRREDAHAFYRALGYADQSDGSGRFTRTLG